MADLPKNPQFWFVFLTQIVIFDLKRIGGIY